jgi:rhamnosyltransferase
MQNISSKSFLEDQRLPRVEVLLATYNGELYIREFLSSLANQVGVEIDLIVSDDGSSDSTLVIINQYLSFFHSVTILKGPNKGPAANFFSLLRSARGTYIALADQDDIWNPRKLLDGITEISSNIGPILQICSLNINGGQLVNSKPFEIPISIMRNKSQGCTMMLNKELLQIIQETKFEYSLMHDWAILLVAQLAGEVIHSPKSGVNYRIHENNFVGIKSFDKRMSIFLRSLMKKGSNSSVYAQANEIHEQLKNFNKNSIAMEKFLQAVRGTFMQRTFYVIANGRIFFKTSGNFLSSLKIVRGTFF